MRKRNSTLRKKTFERDNFTCRKCSQTYENKDYLEVHHVIPLWMKGKDDITNTITLCFDCHKFAPDNPDDFAEYMKEECDGTMTTLIKAWKKAIAEHPELVEEMNKN